MELFIPGLIVLLLSAFFIFLILPRLGTPILLAVCAVSLMLAVWHHAAFFGAEYRLSTWQNGLSNYAPWIVLFFGLLLIIGSIQWVFGNEGSSATPMQRLTTSISSSVTAMPSASSATNPLTAALNTRIRGTRNSPLIPGLNFSASQA